MHSLHRTARTCCCNLLLARQASSWQARDNYYISSVLQGLQATDVECRRVFCHNHHPRQLFGDNNSRKHGPSGRVSLLCQRRPPSRSTVDTFSMVTLDASESMRLLLAYQVASASASMLQQATKLAGRRLEPWSRGIQLARLGCARRRRGEARANSRRRHAPAPWQAARHCRVATVNAAAI